MTVMDSTGKEANREVVLRPRRGSQKHRRTRPLRTDGNAATGGETGACRAVVITCIDYRFVEPLRRFLADEELTGASDLIAWPGGAAAFTTEDAAMVERALETACRLHDPSEVILVAHHDCGRLGGSKSFPDAASEIATLRDALATAAGVVAKRFPALRIKMIRFEESRPVMVDDAGAGGSR